MESFLRWLDEVLVIFKKIESTRFIIPAAVGGIAGDGRPLFLCLPRLYQTGGGIRVSPAGKPTYESLSEIGFASSVLNFPMEFILFGSQCFRI